MRKVLEIAKNIFVWLILALAVCMMIFTIVSANTFNRSDRSLFGYKAFIVLTDSMSKTDFSAGDLVLIKEVDPSTLQAGDIITFTSRNPENFGETVSHKIRERIVDENGEPGFITYGTTTDTNDSTVVTYFDVLGKYQMHLPKVGTFFQYLKTTPGYIFCILLPFLLLILFQGVHCVKIFRFYKKEQMDELKLERERLEAERAESKKMMEELRALKEQIAQQENKEPLADPSDAAQTSDGE